ncbi:alkene reductase [Nocardiopsis sp. HUAS JQ3]|uniref:alkene reductase n=1 Tax=Nocardiopsis sp. HUAS JQ3 TaxID=3061629 RepID=UPI0023A954CB|nr:alkene reductase [Nocardiopsis sp. HUAS JQ3]WDZ93472.1 alkene reductase [Nocardiopsis sp. HUAS JQ3]
MHHDRTALFDPARFGALALSNRVVMSPLTRSRALPDGRPGPSAGLYYAQRASAGLIVSEGTAISPEAIGNPDIPGLWNQEQVRGWKPVTDAVHEVGGTIVAQLWHTGRASHPSLQPGGKEQVGPSAIAINGSTFARDGRTPHVRPRALETEEIPAIVAQYGRAARNARAAGFDGVELHAANGYLIDQFLQDGSNHRTDRYGGSVENRARLLLEALDALIDAVGADRVGVRLSPSSTFQDMADSDPVALFTHVLDALAERDPAYLHLVEPGIVGDDSARRPADSIDSLWVRKRYPGRLIAAGGYDRERAMAAVGEGNADAVAFGRAFIANPDLPRRLEVGAELNEAERATFYGGDGHGYTDYPSLEAERHLTDLREGRAEPVPGLDFGPQTPLEQWHLAWAQRHAAARN